MDSPQKNRNYLGVALGNSLGIKVVNTFTMNELPQLLGHLMLFIEGKAEISGSITGLQISASVGERVYPLVAQIVGKL